MVPVQLVQMDDSCWGDDASQFNPYRFLSKAVKEPELVHTSSLAGFSPVLTNINKFHHNTCSLSYFSSVKFAAVVIRSL